MTTRIYVATGTPDVTPTTWVFTNQVNPVSLPGTTLPDTGLTMTSKTEATTTTSPIFRAMGRTIWGPLSAQTISGTVKGQMRGSESNAGANATLALAMKVIQADGSDRGVLLAQTASDSATTGNELVVGTLTNMAFRNAAESASIALTTQNAQTGDYLVIEWGFRSATTTSRNITLSYGNDSATDLGENTTETAANNPWWELSGDLVLVLAGELALLEDDDTTASAAVVPVLGLLVSTDDEEDTASSGSVALQAMLVQSESDEILVSSGQEPVLQGSLSVVEIPESLTSGATLPVQGTGGLLDDSDTLSGQGGMIPLQGDVDVSDDAEALTSDGRVPLVASLSILLASDILTSVGQGVGVSAETGDLAVTGDPDVASSSAALLLLGTLLVVDDAEGLVSNGVVRVLATLSLLEDADGMQSLAVLRLAATLAALEAEDVLESTQSPVLTGAMQGTDNDETLLGQGVLPVQAGLVYTEAVDTLRVLPRPFRLSYMRQTQLLAPNGRLLQTVWKHRRALWQRYARW